MTCLLLNCSVRLAFGKKYAWDLYNYSSLLSSLLQQKNRVVLAQHTNKKKIWKTNKRQMDSSQVGKKINDRQ
jgi:hypothetical protein